jgi:hypothetical protein
MPNTESYVPLFQSITHIWWRLNQSQHKKKAMMLEASWSLVFNDQLSLPEAY